MLQIFRKILPPHSSWPKLPKSRLHMLCLQHSFYCKRLRNDAENSAIGPSCRLQKYCQHADGGTYCRVAFFALTSSCGSPSTARKLAFKNRQAANPPQPSRRDKIHQSPVCDSACMSVPPMPSSCTELPRNEDLYAPSICNA